MKCMNVSYHPLMKYDSDIQKLINKFIGVSIFKGVQLNIHLLLVNEK